MQKFKIKSLTDVITNSSTEIFTIYNKEAINKIKEMVNSILALNNATSNLTFDDLFEVEYNFETYEMAEFVANLSDKMEKRGYKEHAEVIKYIFTTEELWVYVKQNNIYDAVMEIIDEIDNSYDDCRIVNGIDIKAKNNPNVDRAKLGKVAEILNNIDSIFEQYAYYC